MTSQQNNQNQPKPEKAPQQDQQQPRQPQPDGNAPRQPQQDQQPNQPRNPADPGKGQPQHFQQGPKSGKDDAFKSRGAEDESRGKEGGTSPGAQEMQRDKFSGEEMPRQ